MPFGKLIGDGSQAAAFNSSPSFISIAVVVLLIIFAIFSRGSGMFLRWLLLASSGSSRGWGGGGGSSAGGYSSGVRASERWRQWRRWRRGRVLVILHMKKFINQLPQDTLIAAIREAEEKTSGQIRVLISHNSVVDPVAAAQKEFAVWAWRSRRSEMGS